MKNSTNHMLKAMQSLAKEPQTPDVGHEAEPVRIEQLPDQPQLKPSVDMAHLLTQCLTPTKKRDNTPLS